jgi:hypothetical protein
LKMARNRAAQSIRRPARKQARVNVIDGLTKKIMGPIDPPDVSNDLYGDKTVQLTVAVPTTTGFNVTATTIAAALPGAAANMKFRIKGISAWGPADSNSFIKVVMQDVNSDNAEYGDNGTQGSKRSSVHLRFGLLSSIEWRTSTNIDPIFNVSTRTGTTTDCVIHVKIQYRLPAPTTSGYSLVDSLKSVRLSNLLVSVPSEDTKLTEILAVPTL